MARFSLGGRKQKAASVSGETPAPDLGEETPAAEDAAVLADEPPARGRRISLSGFKDPKRRPRYIIWSGVILLAVATFVVLALNVTSTYWFCAQVCHKVQDDTIIAYNRSSHNKISCMACHEPVNANPVEFVLKKAEALGELYLTATNQYELPLNADSHVAEEMPSEQCTQCHDLGNRTVSASPGVIIDHTVHEEEGIACPQCHNRVAHREDFVMTLKSPNGEKNHAHEDFMTMQGCARCHTQEKGGRASGACNICHPASFSLKPANHSAPNFYTQYGDSSGHWKLYDKDPEYCTMCHTKQFCTDCHGVQMPHPEGFEKNHGAVGRQSPQTCSNCHAASAGTAQGTQFCNACHHKEGDPAKPWLPQHNLVVNKTGAEPCFECHNPTFCATCHVRGGQQASP